MDRNRAFLLAATLVVSAAGLAGCLGGGAGGSVTIVQTGSSTVQPLAEAWAQKFAARSDVVVDVSGGGSSHGRNQLLTGNADIGDASSKMGAGDYEKVGCDVSQSEIDAAQNGSHPWTYPSCNGVTPKEWVVAWDVLTVVVNPNNDWATQLNYSQLRQIFTTEDTARYWDEVDGLEDAPHKEIRIHAPDSASGTYEFFFHEVAGSTDESLLAANNPRYQGSSKDTVILRKVANNQNAVGFFGLSYYTRNSDRVKPVSIAESGTDYVEPSFETASEYPITRPLHLYTDGVPSNDTQKGKALRQYLRYIFSESGQDIVSTVGYVSEMKFEPEGYQAQKSKLS